MYLTLSIIGATILGYLIFSFGEVGIILGFGVIVGCLFRGLYLLNEIDKRLPNAAIKRDKVKEALNQYLAERDAAKKQ
ncbi:hypothetical protein [Bacillus sp. FJAT-22090]|uniref:hypothetical protein n=1 Tax=Bacillus sp. FJAT-22090 TaxID=1581038 RepID=UPI0011A8007E|nr:hypothetical protein [Bacillus sp. FJAT-22090]